MQTYVLGFILSDVSRVEYDLLNEHYVITVKLRPDMGSGGHLKLPIFSGKRDAKIMVRIFVDRNTDISQIIRLHE